MLEKPNATHTPQVRYQSNINAEQTDSDSLSDTSASLVHSITVPGSCKPEKPFQFRVQRSTPKDPRQGAQCKYFTRIQTWSGRGLFVRGLKITKEGSLVTMCGCTWDIMNTVFRF